MDLTLHYQSAITGPAQPGRMSMDAQGNLDVSIAQLNRVMMYDANGQYVRNFGSGKVGTGISNGQGLRR